MELFGSLDDQELCQEQVREPRVTIQQELDQEDLTQEESLVVLSSYSDHSSFGSDPQEIS